MKRSDLFTRGSVAIMTGLIAVPLIAMIGAAIDLSRVWLVKSRLQTSLDAAVLVVARDLANNGTSVAGLNLFWANFGRSTSGGFLGANATTPVVVQAPGGVSGSVQLTSSATLDQVLLGVMGIGQVTVGGTSIAQTAAYGLELALVLDNTGSMAGSSITSLITASNQLLNIVYGGADTQPHLWVSVVPFAAAVNIGNTHTGWLAAGSLNPAAYAPSSWMGCVMARTAATGAQDGDDFNDKKPIDARFQPFLYQSTYHQYTYTWQTGERKKQGHTYLLLSGGQPTGSLPRGPAQITSRIEQQFRRSKSRLPITADLAGNRKPDDGKRRDQQHGARVSRRHHHQPRPPGRLVHVEPDLARAMGYAR